MQPGLLPLLMFFLAKLRIDVDKCRDKECDDTKNDNYDEEPQIAHKLLKISCDSAISAVHSA